MQYLLGVDNALRRQVIDPVDQVELHLAGPLLPAGLAESRSR